MRPHPELHAPFEALGYALGFAAYKQTRRRSGDILSDQRRWTVIAAATFGALIGSRLLELLEQAPRMHIALSQLFTPTGIVFEPGEQTAEASHADANAERNREEIARADLNSSNLFVISTLNHPPSSRPRLSSHR